MVFYSSLHKVLLTYEMDDNGDTPNLVFMVHIVQSWPLTFDHHEVYIQISFLPVGFQRQTAWYSICMVQFVYDTHYSCGC